MITYFIWHTYVRAPSLNQQNLGRILDASKMHLSPPPSGSLGCCQFEGIVFVVVDILFYVLPNVCGCSVLVFVLAYLESFLVLQSSSRRRESCLLSLVVLRMYCYCEYSVALPHGAVCWPLACYCGIS